MSRAIVIASQLYTIRQIRAAYLKMPSITDCVKNFYFRIVSYPVPRTGHSEVKELESKEVYSDKQRWANLLNGKVFGRLRETSHSVALFPY